MKILINALLLIIILIGCSRSDDEHIFTLYSSYKSSNRHHFATFDETTISWNEDKSDAGSRKLSSELNFSKCNKVAELLKVEWENTVKTDEIKYWCEKGRYRK